MRVADLFAGLSGLRLGFEQACADRGARSECVLTSEVKRSALRVHSQNHPGEAVLGDISALPSSAVPDFDVLLAGFPCQAFSAAGQRRGFQDTRGTLFFEVERLLRDKRPDAFLLENVDALVSHDRGRTFATIMEHLRALGYHVEWHVLDSSLFGVAQVRRRVYIAGTLRLPPPLYENAPRRATLADVMEHGLPVATDGFAGLLLKHYSLAQLPGKAIKDKRGGRDNIHSWDIAMKGPVSADERELLDRLLRERRKHAWAEQWGIEWMDGMPLTAEMIGSFFPHARLGALLDDLTLKGYLSLEHPKRLRDGRREADTTLPRGYNIVSGKLSFPINAVLDPSRPTPTLVAMDMRRLYVVDGPGLRPLSLREGLRLFGYPEEFRLDVPLKEGYDLLGNTVVVPVVRHVARGIVDVLTHAI